MLCHAMPCYAISYNVVLFLFCYVISCQVMSCHVILCYARSSCFHKFNGQCIFTTLRNLIISPLIRYWDGVQITCFIKLRNKNQMTLSYGCLALATWWRHQMETFSALLAICAGNSPVTGEFQAQRPVRRSFDLRLNKRVSKQGWHRWFRRHHVHYYVTAMPTPAIHYANSSFAHDQRQSMYSSVWYVNVFLIYVHSLNTALRMLFIDSTRTSPLFAFKNMPLTMSSATKCRLSV